MRLSLVVSVTVAMARGGCLMAFKGHALDGREEAALTALEVH